MDNPMPNTATANELASAMLSDTDVGKVVLGASFVDELLSELIQTRLIEDEISRKLFSADDTDRPFGLEGKSKLAFALGLISHSEFATIRELARTRNQVAHLRMSKVLANKKKVLQPLVDVRLPEAEQMIDAHRENLAARQVEALALTYALTSRVAEYATLPRPSKRVEEKE